MKTNLPGHRWEPGKACGFRLMDGFQPRAIINPNTPRKWNGWTRWRVDTIKLDKPRNVRTLAEAQAIAEANT